ncbi:helix-turn-helix domain-containing protein [Asanoa sp. NPDC049518]|uniref:helix-turn-helix domain-containing protein n=1 Tax=unclassified Asanoa TaxID=2685164 RepID=UPI003414BCD5
MSDQALSPTAEAVLQALTELGQGTLQDLVSKSGRARSTTEKAIKTLVEVGLIVPTDPEADPADGSPIRWTLAGSHEADTTDHADVTAGEAQTIAPGHADGAGSNPDSTLDAEDPDEPVQALLPGDGDPDNSDPHVHDDDRDANDAAHTGSSDGGSTVAAVRPARPGDRKVMAIKGVLADYAEAGATLDVIVAESGIGHPTTVRLLTAMEQADAARRLPGTPERWIAGPTKASEVDPNPEPPRCPLCYQVIRAAASMPGAATAVMPLVQSDGTLHVVGPDGETHVVTLPTNTPPRAPGVARVGRSDATVNADGSQPFSRGELEKLTVDVLAAHQGQAMTPQEIATAIGAQLGRTVSSGAVRNNCTKAAAAGRIVLVSDTPLTFAHPPQSDGDNSDQL